MFIYTVQESFPKIIIDTKCQYTFKPITYALIKHTYKNQPIKLCIA